MDTFLKGGCSAVTHDIKRPSSSGRGKGGRRSRPQYRLLGGGVHPRKKKKGTRQLSTLSLHSGPPASSRLLHPQQCHIPFNNGHFDQRGIPALCLSLSLSRCTRSTGVKDGGHTGYSVPGILIRTQWSLMLCQLRVCVCVY